MTPSTPVGASAAAATAGSAAGVHGVGGCHCGLGGCHWWLGGRGDGVGGDCLLGGCHCGLGGCHCGLGGRVTALGGTAGSAAATAGSAAATATAGVPEIEWIRGRHVILRHLRHVAPIPRRLWRWEVRWVDSRRHGGHARYRVGLTHDLVRTLHERPLLRGHDDLLERYRIPYLAEMQWAVGSGGDDQVAETHSLTQECLAEADIRDHVQAGVRAGVAQCAFGVQDSTIRDQVTALGPAEDLDGKPEDGQDEQAGGQQPQERVDPSEDVVEQAIACRIQPRPDAKAHERRQQHEDWLQRESDDRHPVLARLRQDLLTIPEHGCHVCVCHEVSVARRSRESQS